MGKRVFITCPETNKLSLAINCHKCRNMIQANYRTKVVECADDHGKPHRFTKMLSSEEVE